VLDRKELKIFSSVKSSHAHALLIVGDSGFIA